MALIDDLEGLLSPAEFAKIKGNPTVAARVARGQELIEYFDGEQGTVEVPPIAAGTPPPVRSTPPSGFDLSSIETLLDKKLAAIDTRIDAKLGEFATSRGNEFVNSAVRIAVQRADELNRIYHRHSELTGKPFDSADFNAFLEKPEIKAKGFRTMNDAYEAYAAPTITEKTIEAEVTKRVKATSGANVPGTTPAPSSNKAILTFMRRGSTAEGGGTTGAGRAAATLDRIMARDQERAS